MAPAGQTAEGVLLLEGSETEKCKEAGKITLNCTTGRQPRQAF